MTNLQEPSAAKMLPELLKMFRALFAPAVLDSLDIVGVGTDLIEALSILGKLPRLSIFRPKLKLDADGLERTRAVLDSLECIVDLHLVETVGLTVQQELELGTWKQIAANKRQTVIPED